MRPFAALRRGRDALLGTAYAAGDPRGPAGATILFALTPLLYIAQQLLTRPRAILGGEMYAEMSTNYYNTTQIYAARMQLLAVDAGYIPLPQRIVGLVGWWLGLSPSAIPYYYTGVAIVVSALLVGSICLPAFRPVITSDLLRFALALAILLLLDTETRLYINFTYLVVVPAVFLSALALAGRQVPRWAWILPVLLVSKPAVLTVVPFLVVAAMVARGRFRWVAAVSLLAATAQVVRLAISATLPGSLLQSGPSAPLPEKLLVAAQYTVGFLGRFVAFPNGGVPPSTCMLVGTIVLIALLLLVVVTRSRAGAVVIGGLSLVASGMVLNALIYSNWFNSDLAMLAMNGFDRRVVVALLGTLIAAAGAVAALLGSPLLRHSLTRLRRRAGLRPLPAVGAALRTAAVLVFVGWLTCTGWFRYSAFVNAPIFAPFTDVSKWQAMAPALSSGQPVVCIPTAPFGWSAYGRNCATLSGEIPAGLTYQPIKEQANGTWSATIPVPAVVRGRTLAAIAILVLPTHADRAVSATLTVTTSSGERRVFRAADRLPLTGGALLFENSPADLLVDPRSVALTFDAPVKLGWAARSDGSGQGVVAHWMGQ